MKRYGSLPGGRELQQAVGQTAAVLERLAPAAGGSSAGSSTISLAELVRGTGGGGREVTGGTLSSCVDVVSCNATKKMRVTGAQLIM